ncbi:MAG: class I SAM-dependent methyltransferase [Acidimicrobiales bacterium]
MPDWSHWRKNVDLDAYDERWRQMEASGQNPHGEADFVDDVLAGMRPASVLDAGCGTGRVAIELARRDVDVVGVDLDEDLLDRARAKAPDLTWVQADLARLDLGRTFDVVALAGNVVPYIAEADRAAAVAACARHVGGNGRMVAGFQLAGGWPTIVEYDAWCAAAGLELEARFAAWDEAPFDEGATYAVSVHRWPQPAGEHAEPPDEPVDDWFAGPDAGPDAPADRSTHRP